MKTRAASSSPIPSPTLAGSPDRSKPLRVFHLIKGLGRGGAEMLLVQGQRASGRRCHYGYGYLLPAKDALAAPLRAAGGEVVCFNAPSPLRMLASVSRVARHLRAWRADLLHCHLPITGVLGRVAGRLAGVPVVYTEHNLQERYHPLTRRLNRISGRLQSRVIAVSAEVADSIRRSAGGWGAVEVLRNGVSVELFSQDPEGARRVRRELGIPEQAPIVGTVAVFRQQKALDHWLEAARTIADAVPPAHFVLVGDGPLAAELKQLAGRLGLSGSVHWPGLQEDVRPYLSAIDLFLMSSRFEGLPVALLEAMAMERPVVATRVGGIPEVVVDGDTGLLAAAGRPDLLAEAALRVLADRELQTRMGRRSRLRVEQEFSADRMLSELEELYTQVLRGRR